MERIYGTTTLNTDKEKAKSDHGRATKGGKTWSGEFKVLIKQGTNFPAFLTIQPFMTIIICCPGIIGI